MERKPATGLSREVAAVAALFGISGFTFSYPGAPFMVGHSLAKEVTHMYVTYSDFIQLGMLIIMLISLYQDRD